MKNLLESINIPTIFLDNNYLLKGIRFTQQKVVNLIPSDIGRPINHLATNFKYENFIEDAKEVLRTLAVKELSANQRCRWYLMRILPYRTTSNVIDGVVITFTDINKLKITSEEIKS